MKWYYEKNGKQQGPVEEAALQGMLQRGELTPKDLVWHEGMGDWAPAGRLAELANKTGLAGVSGYAESAPSGIPGIAPKPESTTEYGSVPTVFPEVAKRQEEAQKGNPLALVSMIAGILCLLFCAKLIFSIPLSLLAVVTGHMASGKYRKGAGVAKAGLVLGYLGVVLSLVVGGVSLYFMKNPDLAEKFSAWLSEQAQQK